MTSPLCTSTATAGHSRSSRRLAPLSLRAFVPSLRLPLVLAAIAGCVLTAGTARAERYETAIESLASEVAKFLGEKDQAVVKVEDFRAGEDTSTGRRIRLDLSEALRDNHNVTVPTDKKEALKLRDALRVTGEISSGAAGGRPIVVIKAKVRGKGNTELTEFRERFQSDREVTDTGTIAELLGLNVDQQANFEDAKEKVVAEAEADGETVVAASDEADTQTTTEVSGTSETAASTVKTGVVTDAKAKAKIKQETVKANRAEVAKQIEEGPKFFQVSTSRMAASEGSNFQMEVLVKRGGTYQPIDIEDLSGLAFADLANGDVYAVRLINNSEHDVSVELMIDGLNTLRFSDDPGFRDLGRWVINRGTSGTIKGWHFTGSRVHEFLITAAPDSRVAELQEPTSSIGIITASFYPAFREGEQKSEFESLIASQSLGTGKGAELDDRNVSTVQRQHGKQRLATMSIRYINPDPPVDLPNGQ